MDHWRNEIETLIDSEDRAWTAGNAAAFSAAVASDCVFTNIFGQVFVGNNEFEQQHARIFATIYNGSRLEQTIDHVRLLRPDVVIANTSATVTVPAGQFGPARNVQTKLLQLFAHDGARWQIVSFHNVEERPLPTG